MSLSLNILRPFKLSGTHPFYVIKSVQPMKVLRRFSAPYSSPVSSQIPPPPDRSCFDEVTPTKDLHPGYIKIKETQKKYQKKDGLPIFLKCGNRDQLLYRFTMGLAIYGVLAQFLFYYDCIFPAAG